MNSEATSLLETELAALRQRPYQDLVIHMAAGPLSCERVGVSGAKYQIEIQAFWDDRPGGNIRVMGSVDDGTLLRATMPVSRDFIMAPNGSFIGE